MVPGSRAEVPQDRLVVLRQQREPADFVLRPGADVGGGEVPHIVHVEAQQRAHFGLLKQSLGLLQSLPAQAVEVDALLPIHRHASISFQCHSISPAQIRFNWTRPTCAPALQTGSRSRAPPGPCRAPPSAFRWLRRWVGGAAPPRGPRPPPPPFPSSSLFC